MKKEKLQKEINTIAKLNVTGELYIEIELKVENYKELEEKSDSILEGLMIPEGLTKNENYFYKKDLTIYISFKKV